MFKQGLPLILLCSLFVSACGGGGGSDTATAPAVSTRIEVFDGAATGCSVTVNGVAATEIGEGAYSFDGTIDDGVVIRASGCTDADTGLLLPAMSGVAESGGGVVSPITTLIVESVLVSNPTATRLSSDDIVEAVNKIISNLDLIGYDPTDPATANYVAAAKADASGTGISATAMRVALAISTLLKGAEVAAGSADAGAAVSTIAQAIANAAGTIDLSSSVAIDALINEAIALASPPVAAALTVANTAVTPSIVIIITTTGTISDTIAVSTAIAAILNSTDETTIAGAGFSVQLETAAANAAAATSTPPADVNSPPVIEADTTLSIDEGAAPINGQVIALDPDGGSTAIFTITGSASAPSGFVLNPDGSFSFDPSNAAYDNLNVGGSAVLTIPVTATDDQGASDTAQIQITVNGTNDQPIAGDDVLVTVDTDDATINGLLTSSDIDDGSTASFEIAVGEVAPAGFILNPDGSYSFNPADLAYASLNIGDSQLITISTVVRDDQDGTDNLEILINLNRVLSRPIALDDIYNTFGNTLLEVGVTPSGSIATKVSGSVLDNDSDIDTDDMLTASIETQPVSGGSVSMDALGNFSYVPPVGLTTFVDSFTYRVSNGVKFSIGTVTINVSEKIWYVDNLSSSGAGTSDDPFASIAEAELVAEDGDTIYVAYGDGTTLGLDNGLTLSVPNLKLIGEGAALLIGSTTLADAGNAPSITNAGGDGITLNAADNTLIKGINIDNVSGDGIVIDDSTGVVIEAVTISNSGESAVEGSGADIELFLTDVIIDTVDVVDPSISDDAIFMAPTASVSLVMSGGSIDGVPGSLGDGIVFRNENSANEVSMNLDVTAVRFMNIAQDGIKLDNDLGDINAQIGGPTLAEGNVFNVGFRGIQIQTDIDPTAGQINRIMIQNNTITSANESIQIRHVKDQANLSILDNIVSRPTWITVGAIIDVQSEDNAFTQARINRNDINNLGGSEGMKVRVLDGATLTMEVLGNDIDGPRDAFVFDVIEARSFAIARATLLNSTVLDNVLNNIGSAAMYANSVSFAYSEICMDLLGNSPEFDYVLFTVFDGIIPGGDIGVTTTSQTVIQIGTNFFAPTSDVCPVPTF